VLAVRCLILRPIARVPSTLCPTTMLPCWLRLHCSMLSFDSTAFVRLPVDRTFPPIVIDDELSPLRDCNSSLHQVSDELFVYFAPTADDWSNDSYLSIVLLFMSFLTHPTNRQLSGKSPRIFRTTNNSSGTQLFYFYLGFDS
jgi:hypothetical protein